MKGWKFWQRGPVNHRAKARSYYNVKNYKKAEKHLLALLDERPTDTWALDVLGRLFMNTNRHLDAIQVWNDYISAGGELGRGLSYLSSCQRVNGDIDNAFETLKQVLLESPDDDSVWKEIHKTIDSVDNINQIISKNEERIFFFKNEGV